MKLAGRTEDEDVLAEYEAEIKRLKIEKSDLQSATQPTNQYTSEQFRTATEKVFAILKEPVKMWQSDDYNRLLLK